jgi:hypothetical protein
MVAFANREALAETLRTGYAHYFSRSRGKLWKKGETSGHVQRIRAVLVDCDRDTVLYLVEQTAWRAIAAHAPVSPIPSSNRTQLCCDWCLQRGANHAQHGVGVSASRGSGEWFLGATCIVNF